MDLYNLLLAKKLSGGGGGSNYDITGYMTITNNVVINNRLVVNIPEGVVEVNSSVFNNEPIETLILPTTLQKAGTYSFNSLKLTSITCKAITPPRIENNTFNNVPADCAIYVPSESVDAYKAASNWSARAAYIQAIPN